MAKSSSKKGNGGSAKPKASVDQSKAQSNSTPNLPAVSGPTVLGPERPNTQSAAGATVETNLNPAVETQASEGDISMGTNKKSEAVTPEVVTETDTTPGTFSKIVSTVKGAFMKPVGDVTGGSKLPESVRSVPTGAAVLGLLLLAGAAVVGGRKLFGSKKSEPEA